MKEIQGENIMKNTNMNITIWTDLTDKLRKEKRSGFSSVQSGKYTLSQEVIRGKWNMKLLNSKGEVLFTSKPQLRRSHALLNIMIDLGLEKHYGNK